MSDRQKLSTAIVTWQHVEQVPTLTRRDFLSKMEEVVGAENIEYYAIGLEEYPSDGTVALWPPDHASGEGVGELSWSERGWHIHMGLKLKKEYRYTADNPGSPFAVEGLVPFVKKGYRGPWGWQKAVQGAVKYAMKEDLGVLTNIENFEEFVKKLNEKGAGAGAAVCALLNEGALDKQIWDEQPAFYLRWRKNILDVRQDLKRFKRQHDRPAWQVIDPSKLPRATLPVLQMVTWLNENVGVPRRHRQKQLYVRAPKATGKTYFVTALSKYLNIMQLCNDESKFYDGFDDDVVKMLWIDEFRGQWRPTQLNKLAEGGTIEDGVSIPLILQVKGGHVEKVNNQPLIVCSQYHFYEQYQDAKDRAAVEALEDRFTHISLQEGDRGALRALSDLLLNKQPVVRGVPDVEIIEYPPLGGAASAESPPPFAPGPMFNQWKQDRARKRAREDDDSDDDTL